MDSANLALMFESAGVDLIELSGGTHEALPWLNDEKVRNLSSRKNKRADPSLFYSGRFNKETRGLLFGLCFTTSTPAQTDKTSGICRTVWYLNNSLYLRHTAGRFPYFRGNEQRHC